MINFPYQDRRSFIYQDRRGYRGGILITLQEGYEKKASVDLACEHSGIEICNFKAHPPRGKGYGKILMKHILEEFKNNELFLVCEPKLKGFYEQFGFKEITTTIPTTSPHSLSMLTMSITI